MKRYVIIIFVFIYICTSNTSTDKAKVEVAKMESKPISQIEKSTEVSKPNIIYDTLVFTENMNGEILSEKFKTSHGQLKFYKGFINLKNINRLKTITEKHTKTEIKYLGKIKDLDGLNSYDVITNFQIWGIGQMLSPRGRSEVAFVNKDKIIIYNLAMPYELPEKIEKNILYFRHEQTKIGNFYFRWTFSNVMYFRNWMLLKTERTTLGFMQVGLDLVTSANCKSQLQFQPTNYYQLLYITSSTYFQSAAVIGRRNTNSQPA